MVGVKRRYALHMKDRQPTLEGLLIHRRKGHYVLIDAEILEATDRTHSLEGRVEVPRENVYCLQEVQ
jgi:hypothetical protein